MKKELKKYIDKQISDFSGNWNYAGKELVYRTLLANAKNKKDVDEIILDSCWYSVDDFVRIWC